MNVEIGTKEANMPEVPVVEDEGTHSDGND